MFGQHKDWPCNWNKAILCYPEIVEKPDKPVLEQDLIMEEQGEQKSVSSLLFN